ncbi:MAG: hypothetical protein M3256_22790, partial [Actinomycetota bacterium]|nr:hypothetical protein [Actinomycetota bacterium]
MLQSVMADLPEDAVPHCLAAQCLLALDRPTDALVQANEAVRLNPNLAWAHRLASLSLRGQMASSVDGVRAAREAVRLAPGEAINFVVASDAERALGDLRAAWASANEAVRLAPDSASGHVAVGLVALSWRDYRLAEQAFRHAVALEPTAYAAMNNLGVALIAQRRRLAGLRAYGHAIPLSPGDTLAKRNVLRAVRSVLIIVVLALVYPFPLIPIVAISAWGAWGPLGLVLVVLAVAAVVTGGALTIRRLLPAVIVTVIHEAVGRPARRLVLLPRRLADAVHR